jgi:UPF0271 protein
MGNRKGCPYGGNKMHIDLNSDLGESFGRYTLGNDEALMPFITSANVACGFHAGDSLVMQNTVRLARRHHVGIGAHPSYPDLQGFGRREMSLSPDEVEAMIVYQVSALWGFVKSESAELIHVKPHGALYNQAAKDRDLAEAIARGVKRFSQELILVGLAGSKLIESGIGVGLRVANEGFPERGYNADGSLMSRKLRGAIIESPEEAAANALRMAREGLMTNGLKIEVETLCIHGDNARAVEIARAVRGMLTKNEIDVKSLTR